MHHFIKSFLPQIQQISNGENFALAFQFGSSCRSLTIDFIDRFLTNQKTSLAKSVRHKIVSYRDFCEISSKLVSKTVPGWNKHLNVAPACSCLRLIKNDLVAGELRKICFKIFSTDECLKYNF